jgi:predicted dienelactone hydrolase
MRIIAALLLAVATAGHAAAIQTCEAQWVDTARNGRAVPVRIRMPQGAGQAPVILFSHGLGGSLDAGTKWVSQWAQAGFITINLQHAGSDAAIWRGSGRPMQGLRRGMTAEQLQARVGDVRFVLDRLERGGREGACDLGRADMGRIGMSGHSFGAQTTLAIAGTRYGGRPVLADARVKAALAFSPQPAVGQADTDAFGAIHIPFFTVTGTEDSTRMLSGVGPEDRLRPYRAMPPGGKYLLVLKGANHMMLGGQTAGRKSTPTDHMLTTIDRLTTLFWQASLLDDRAAAAALARAGQTMAPGDRFEHK